MFKAAFSLDQSLKSEKITEYSAILEYLQIPCDLAFEELLLNNLNFSIHKRIETFLQRTTGQK